jgi:hypothetical protein
VPRALILTTVSKANTTGGTFADTLVANSCDSTAVQNYESGGARVLEMWGIDSDSVAEVQVIYTRPESTHDQSHGLRFMIPSLVPGGAAAVAGHDLMPGLVTFDVYSGDVPTIQASSTAADDVLLSYVTEYDNLPGISAVLSSWETVAGLQKSAVGIRCDAVASATPGAYGATRAINTDDDRLHGNTWYAILGVSVQTPVTTIAISGPDWGGAKIGVPCGVQNVNSTTWFVDQTKKWNKPLIPCFNSANKGSVFLQVADGEASTSPKIDVFLYELNGQPA